MEAYRVHENIVAWIEAFLTVRTQRVKVYDSTGKIVYSGEIPVVSRVPQGLRCSAYILRTVQLT